MYKTISVRVTGKVQGVFFRQSTKEKARELGITGLVKNEADGSVYIVATGTGAQLDELVTWCRQGPPRAKVESVKTNELVPQVFESFTIQHG